MDSKVKKNLHIYNYYYYYFVGESCMLNVVAVNLKIY